MADGFAGLRMLGRATLLDGAGLRRGDSGPAG